VGGNTETTCSQTVVPSGTLTGCGPRLSTLIANRPSACSATPRGTWSVVLNCRQPVFRPRTCAEA
jgi:hypothetical protein